MFCINKLQVGDLIFTANLPSCNNLSLTKQIQNVGLNYSSLSVDHVGIYIGNSQVVEATPPFVRVINLFDFITSTNSLTYFYIKRVKDNTLTKKAVSFAIASVGIPYNNYYLKNNKSFYCSELITEAYKFANNNSNYFNEHIMKFTNINNSKIDSIWLDLYGGNSFVPKAEFGSHPSSLLESNLLINV